MPPLAHSRLSLLSSWSPEPLILRCLMLTPPLAPSHLSPLSSLILQCLMLEMIPHLLQSEINAHIHQGRLLRHLSRVHCLLTVLTRALMTPHCLLGLRIYMWWTLYRALRSVRRHVVDEEVWKRHLSSISRSHFGTQHSTTTLDIGITHWQLSVMKLCVLAIPLLDCGLPSWTMLGLRSLFTRGIRRRRSEHWLVVNLSSHFVTYSFPVYIP